MKLVNVAFYFLVTIVLTRCTGVHYGIDGGETVPRDEAVKSINLATLLKSATCKLDSKTANLIVLNFVQNQRKVLDGAYYTKKDIKNCLNTIYFADCSNFYAPCKMSPKEFLESGPYFQGGF